MPRFCTNTVFETESLRVQRIECDGHDSPRQSAEVLDGDRIIIVLDGCFSFRNHSCRVAATAGTALLIPAGEEFEISHPHSRGDVCFAFRGELSLNGLMSRRAFDIGVAELAAFVHVMSAVSRGDKEGLLIEETLSQLLPQIRDHNDHDMSCDAQIADAVMYCVKMHSSNRVTLKEIARAAGISVFHACRAFRRATGGTIHGYLTEIRLKHAVSLLLDTEYSLTRIAYELGFSNPGHFTNSFKQRFGIPPSQFRALGPQQRMAA